MSDEKRSKAYVDWRLRAPPVGHAMSSEVFLAGYDAREPELAQLRARIEELEGDKNAAYSERNKLVAVLTRLYPSGKRATDIPGWDPEWHGCVFIDSPAGQLSWHYHDSEADLFADLPPYTKPWDGHTTEEKYARLENVPEGFDPPSMVIAALNDRIEELEGNGFRLNETMAKIRSELRAGHPGYVERIKLHAGFFAEDPAPILTIHRGGPIGGGPEDNGGT